MLAQTLAENRYYLTELDAWFWLRVFHRGANCWLAWQSQKPDGAAGSGPKSTHVAAGSMLHTHRMGVSIGCSLHGFPRMNADRERESMNESVGAGKGAPKMGDAGLITNIQSCLPRSLWEGTTGVLQKASWHLRHRKFSWE